MTTVRVEGHAGTVRVGYDEAARLGRWALDLNVKTGSVRVTGVVTRANAWRLSQPDLTVALEVGRNEWVWPCSGAAVDGKQFVLDTSALIEIRRGVVAVARTQQ